MKIKKGIIPNVSLLVGIIIYEIIVIFVFNWTGVYRMILAAIVGGASYSIGKSIENKIVKDSSLVQDTKTINLVSFAIIIFIVVGLNFFSRSNKTNKLNENEDIQNIFDSITNSKTYNHIYIPTTKIFLVPPENYQFIEKMQRFQKDDNTYFQIVEMPGVDFNKNELTKENFEAKGAKIYNWKDFFLNRYSAKLIILQENYLSKNIFLSFGDSSFSAMAAGYCLINDTLSEKEILQSLNSIYYDTSISIDYLSHAKFEIDLKNTNYQFAKYASNTYVYTEEGILDDNNPYQNSFMVSQIISNGIDENTLGNYSLSLIESFEQQGLNIEITTSESKKVNDYNGYIIIGDAYHEEKQAKVYLQVIADFNSTISFTGIIGENQKETMKLFESISKTLKIKE